MELIWILSHTGGAIGENKYTRSQTAANDYAAGLGEDGGTKNALVSKIVHEQYWIEISWKGCLSPYTDG